MADDAAAVLAALRKFIEENGRHIRPVPIVPNARFAVWCPACEYAHDSAEKTAEAAVAEIAPRHSCPGTALIAEAVDYTEHPMFKGRYAHEDRAGRKGRFSG